MEAKPRVLCVDDEPQLLEGLSLMLRRRFDVQTAPGGEAGLELLRADPSVVCVVSDMRMPGMDGATFLREARALVPDTTRILLTGQTDLDAAIAAVNFGQVFRFLQKPVSPDVLQGVLQDGVEHHRLRTAERVLLEQTLQGAVKALTDVLALTRPLVFGRASRIKQHVGTLARTLGLADVWQLEVAALLAQLGAVTLPDEVAEKLHDGRALSAAEQKMADAAPATVEHLLGHIPRLEGVRELLRWVHRPSLPAAQAHAPSLRQRVQVLRLATDYERLVVAGTTPELASLALRAQAELGDAALFDALLHLAKADFGELSEVGLDGLRVGMVFAEEVRMTSGGLLVPRGYTVTASFLERARNFQAGVLRLPLKVMSRKPATAN